MTQSNPVGASIRSTARPPATARRWARPERPADRRHAVLDGREERRRYARRHRLPPRGPHPDDLRAGAGRLPTTRSSWTSRTRRSRSRAPTGMRSSAPRSPCRRRARSGCDDRSTVAKVPYGTKMTYGGGTPLAGEIWTVPLDGTVYPSSRQRPGDDQPRRSPRRSRRPRHYTVSVDGTALQLTRHDANNKQRSRQAVGSSSSTRRRRRAPASSPRRARPRHRAERRGTAGVGEIWTLIRSTARSTPSPASATDTAATGRAGPVEGCSSRAAPTPSSVTGCLARDQPRRPALR